MKDYIKRAKELNLSHEQIAYIFFNEDLDKTKEVINRSGLASKTKPNCMPDSYFIQRLSQNTPIKDIAEELGCSRMAVYNLLKRRGLSPDAFRQQLK